MKVFIFIICTFSFFSVALASSKCRFEYKYVVEGKEKIFCVLKENNFLVDPECIGDHCGYQKAMSSKMFSEITLSSDELRYGKNPATIVCLKVGGHLLPVQSEFGHQSFFCRFEDDSIIDSESIYQSYLQQRN